ncbi:FAD-binding protein [Mycolicibacterium farcinogenes]|nr:FAD-binding protein [Mycolicibacterium farcinogenes]
MTDHCVVLGAGIAGLLAAAALADTGRAVTVVERDVLPDNTFQRRGIPQGPHLHSLLSQGWRIMEELVPGLINDVIAAGAHVLDDARMGARMYIQNGPYSFNRTEPVADPAALASYLVTRPLLESVLRRRVVALPTVTIKDGHDIGDLVADQPGRITGVTVSNRRTGATQTLEADLVIDATGRATRTPLLLETLRYGRPPRWSFTVHGVYYSQQIAIPDEDTFPERLVLVVPSGSAGRGGLAAGERGTWTLPSPRTPTTTRQHPRRSPKCSLWPRPSCRRTFTRRYAGLCHCQISRSTATPGAPGTATTTVPGILTACSSSATRCAAWTPSTGKASPWPRGTPKRYAPISMTTEVLSRNGSTCHWRTLSARCGRRTSRRDTHPTAG